MELKAEKKDHDDDENGARRRRQQHHQHRSATAAAASATAMDVDAATAPNGGNGDELSDQEIVEVGIDEDHIKFLTSMHSGDEEPTSNGHRPPSMVSHRTVSNGVTGNGRQARTNIDNSSSTGGKHRRAAMLHVPAHRNGTGRTYQCDVCPRIFHRPDHLRYHMRIHEKNNPFECKLCFSVFASDPAFAHHIRTEHAGMGLADALPPVPETEANFFACTYCDKSFTDAVELEEHLHQQHLGERPFKCNMCPKAFIRMDFLQCHYQK
uniref:C2H2-type domain-containing protein n=1 Tax=Anopheles maculatus TaxID=74869 RepID=A0A182T5C6_9DIPT